MTCAARVRPARKRVCALLDSAYRRLCIACAQPTFDGQNGHTAVVHVGVIQRKVVVQVRASSYSRASFSFILERCQLPTPEACCHARSGKRGEERRQGTREKDRERRRGGSERRRRSSRCRPAWRSSSILRACSALNLHFRQTAIHEPGEVMRASM